jgi:predicted nucleic acid-binding protein
MTPYADSNFFTRVYLQLTESEQADRLLRLAEQRKAAALPLTWLHRVEIANAFRLHVFQSANAGQPYITLRQAEQALGHFRSDMQRSEFVRQIEIPFEQLEKRFEELSVRRTTRHGFRTYDLLHVSSALVLGCDTFWSFDGKASRLARLEGLKVR